MTDCDPFKDEEWIPLNVEIQSNPPSKQLETSGEDPKTARHVDMFPRQPETNEILVQDIRKKNQHEATNHSISISRTNKTLQEIRNQHEANQSLKQDLFNRPLSRFPVLFIGNLLREIWNCEYSVRLGVFLICFGLCTQAISFNFVFYFTMQSLPKILLATALAVILGYVYISPTAMTKINEWKKAENVADGIFTLFEIMDGTLLKRIVIGIVICIPVIMEMSALLFLARLVGESDGSLTKVGLCWITFAFQIVFLLPLHFGVEYSASARNKTDGMNGNGSVLRHWGNGRYLFWRCTLIKKPSTTLFDCRMHSWICLYTMALITTIIQVNFDQIHRPIILAGPFTLATGAFLILSRSEGNEQDLLADIMRRVLRRTLRDILVEVGEGVAEDEMLRLAMLRWIADYWASSRNGAEEGIANKRKNTNNNSAKNKEEEHVRIVPDRVQDSATTSQVGAKCKISSLNDDSMGPSSSAADPTSSSDEIGWSQLSTMLSLTIEQMIREVRNSESESGGQYSTTHIHSSGSIQGLQALLSSFHRNERAKPAVESYKKAIADISPSRNLAMYAGLASRCPAFLSAVYLYIVFPFDANLRVLILLPLVCFEAMRVSEWIVQCRRAEGWFRLRNQDTLRAAIVQGESWVSSLFPLEMTPMEIILSQDTYSPFTPGKLLQVWLNVQSSVVALESGLTAMKCVHTVKVATDVAFHVVSLTKFGMELKSKGFGLGLGLIVLDIFHFHLKKSTSDPSSQHDSNFRGMHAAAVLDIAEKSQMFTRNVSELVEESKDERNFLSPVVSFFGGLLESSTMSNDGQVSTEKSISVEPENISNTDENIEVELRQLKGVEEPVQLIISSQCTSQISFEGEIERTALLQDLELDDSESDDRSKNSLCSNNAEEDSIFGDDDESWTAIDEMPNIEVGPILDIHSEETSVTKDNGEVSAPTHAVRHQVIESNQNNNLKWVGAGIAILGTVIGGVVFTGNNNSGDNNRSDDKESSKRSTVTIERLEDDE